MNKNNHEKQLLLKETKGNFSFLFATMATALYIDSLEQNINYGWEEVGSGGILDKFIGNSTTELGFSAKKNSHSIDLNGYIYINSEMGSGLDNFIKLKQKAGEGSNWYLVAYKPDQNGNETSYKVKGSGEGIWYIESIRQTASNFITGLNALKIEFNIVLKKYK